MNGDLAIEAVGLRKRYGERVAVDGVELRVARGEVFGLLGPNGAGKTSILRMVLGILPADEGEIRLLGDHPTRTRDRVGFLPEERGLYRDLGVLECLVYLARLRGMGRAAARAGATRALERLGLGDRAEARVGELSRGLLQKAQIASAIAHDPELVVLDEPFQGLDPVNVGLVRELVGELHAAGRTVVICAHELGLVQSLCERVVLLDHGRVALAGGVDELRRRWSPDAVEVEPPVDASTWPEVAASEPAGRAVRLRLAPGATVAQIAARVVASGHPLDRLERVLVPLDEVFRRVVSGEQR